MPRSSPQSGVLRELVEAAQARAQSLPSAADERRSTRADFAAAVAGRDRVAVIAEFKRRSPSRGGLAPDARVDEQVGGYVASGAAAVSVLCEPTRFGGSTTDLEAAARAFAVPLLLKDFVVDERQVAAAVGLGASAVLLIARCLTDVELERLARACVARGLTPLVECHEAIEVERALEIPEAVIGVNNRNLDTLTIDRRRGEALLDRIPEDRVAVAESGYETPAQIRALRGRADAVLVGSALMTAADPASFVREVLS